MGELSADRLAAVGLFEGLDDASREALAGELSLVEVVAGETLFRQGDEADSVFIVLAGELSAHLDQPAGSDQLLAKLEVGDIVGEVAILAGGTRSATVRVDRDAQLAQLPVQTLDRLLADHPAVAEQLGELVSRRLRRSQLATHLSNIFDHLEDDALIELEESIEWISVPGGEMLYQEGDPGDAAYLVVSGRMRAVAHDPEERLLHEVARGDMVGELSLVEDAPRTHTVFAARDTDLARLPRAAFEELLERRPLAMLGVLRTVLRRSRESAPSLRRQLGAELSIAVIPAAPGVAIEGFVAQLVEALQQHGSTMRLDPQRVDALLGKPGVANSLPSDPAHIRLVQSLHEIEDQNRFVVYEADPTWTQWSQRAMRQADYLLTVGDAGEVRPPSDTERQIGEHRKSRHPHWGLVLLHEPSTTRPSDTARWLVDRERIESIYHVRRRDRADMERLARILAGCAVSIVFGGGGARGFAHLGVMRALEELGIPVDMAGGTSIGAPMASCVARGMTAAEALEEAIVTYDSILDFTLPLVSMMPGHGITGAIFDCLGEWDIEDLWKPFFCVSTNITRAGPVIHRRGSLHRAARASVAIPGVLPPVPDGEDLLVDGGVLNNLPIDVMRELNPSGPIIAVDVVPPRGPTAKSDYGLTVSGWKVALGRMLPSRRIDAPGIGTTMMRTVLVGADAKRQRVVEEGLADLYINVRMKGIGMLDFGTVEPVAQFGYEQGIEALRKWVDGGGFAPGSGFAP